MSLEKQNSCSGVEAPVGSLSAFTPDQRADFKSLPTIGSGEGFFLSTYGCQMNVNDSERMTTLLEMMNFESVSSPEKASLIIINSCSVREKPVQKVHSEVGRYRKLKELNPRLKIGVAGCVAQQEKGKLKETIPLIDFVIGTDAIDQLPQIIAKVREGESVVSARFEHAQPYHVNTLVRNPGVSTFVNITKGCDNFCTFCVVPFTRGRERSRPLQHLIQDIKGLVERGVKEVTLLGQNVNSYTSDCGADFADLLMRVAEDTGIERIRYTTSHPKDFNDKLVGVMRDYREKVMNYVHLPAQSGSSPVLQRMNRGYTREEYMDKARSILESVPDCVLSTDIIVGFPGETEEQFAETLSLLDEVSYENIYAFCYSPRPFTKAARFVDQLSDEVKKQRLQRVLSKHTAQTYEMAKAYQGKVFEVLIDQFDRATGRSIGRTTHNKTVHFANSSSEVGQTVSVRIVEAFPQTLRGELVG